MEQLVSPPAQNELSAQSVDPPLPETLPPVQESDQSIQAAVESLFGGKTVYKLLYMENFIQGLMNY